MVRAEDYGKVFDGVQSYDALRQALGDLSRSLGFQNFVYQVVRAPAGGQRLRLSGAAGPTVPSSFDGRTGAYPKEVLSRVGLATMPYRWVQFAHAEWEKACLSRFFDADAISGLKCGVTVPLHGPAGGVAALCFASCDSPPAMDGHWSQYMEDFIVIGSYVHQVAQRSEVVSGGESPHLTMRESEVLLWTARGKTAWEIGEILDIAEETVRFHLKNATRKFGVGSKHQAVIQAIVYGLIVP